MSADLSFRKCDFLSAANLFHKLLSQRSNFWLALVRMVEVKRRLGVLHEAVIYLKSAGEVVNPNDSGLSYCSGTYIPVITIDIIYYYVIWTDNGSTL